MEKEWKCNLFIKKEISPSGMLGGNLDEGLSCQNPLEQRKRKGKTERKREREERGIMEGRKENK